MWTYEESVTSGASCECMFPDRDRGMIVRNWAKLLVLVKSGCGGGSLFTTGGRGAENIRETRGVSAGSPNLPIERDRPSNIGSVALHNVAENLKNINIVIT
jgi:hypothetical protein